MHMKFWFCQDNAEYQRKALKVVTKFPDVSRITNHKQFPGFHLFEIFSSTIPKPKHRADASATSLVIQAYTKMFESIKGVMKF